MGIFGGIEHRVERALGERPPEIPPGATVQLASVPVSGVVEGTLEQRPYWVMLDDDHQEVGDRHWLTRQTFTDLGYATAYCAWVQSGGKVPLPDFPAGAV